MSNNNESDYYEESSTDEETVASAASSSAPSSSAPSSSAPSSSVGPSSAAGPSLSLAGPSLLAAGPSSSSAPVAAVAPRPVLQASTVVAQGVLENPGEQSFLSLFNRRDVDRLENWASLSRSMRGSPGFALSGAPIPNAFVSFLRANLGARWEGTLLSPLGELVLCQLRAYIDGFCQLTSFERGQWVRLYQLWTREERASQLRRLAEKGGFLEIE